MDDDKWEQVEQYVDERDMKCVVESLAGAEDWAALVKAWYRTMMRAYDAGCIETTLESPGLVGKGA